MDQPRLLNLTPLQWFYFFFSVHVLQVGVGLFMNDNTVLMNLGLAVLWSAFFFLFYKKYKIAWHVIYWPAFFFVLAFVLALALLTLAFVMTGSHSSAISNPL